MLHCAAHGPNGEINSAKEAWKCTKNNSDSAPCTLALDDWCKKEHYSWIYKVIKHYQKKKLNVYLKRKNFHPLYYAYSLCKSKGYYAHDDTADPGTWNISEHEYRSFNRHYKQWIQAVSCSVLNHIWEKCVSNCWCIYCQYSCAGPEKTELLYRFDIAVCASSRNQLYCIKKLAVVDISKKKHHQNYNDYHWKQWKKYCWVISKI